MSATPSDIVRHVRQVDRTITRDTPRDRAGRLTLAVNRVLAEPEGVRRLALFHHAVSASIQVAHDQHDLAAWLDRAWNFLDQHPDHPDFTAREDAWLERLAAYEQVSDALVHAKRLLQ